MLIDDARTLTPLDSRTHIRYSFRLEETAVKLNLSIAYGPKRLEDGGRARRLMEACIDRYVEPERRALVKGSLERYLPLNNLITISVDDPLSYRGACHRHDPELHLYLSEPASSPGLTSGPLPAGVWTVTLSVHAVVTERCEVRLRVWADEGAVG